MCEQNSPGSYSRLVVLHYGTIITPKRSGGPSAAPRHTGHINQSLSTLDSEYVGPGAKMHVKNPYVPVGPDEKAHRRFLRPISTPSSRNSKRNLHASSGASSSMSVPPQPASQPPPALPTYHRGPLKMPVGQQHARDMSREMEGVEERMQAAELQNYIRTPGSTTKPSSGQKGGAMQRKLTPQKGAAVGDVEMTQGVRVGGGAWRGGLNAGDVEAQSGGRMFTGTPEAFDVEEANKKITPQKVGVCGCVSLVCPLKYTEICVPPLYINKLIKCVLCVLVVEYVVLT